MSENMATGEVNSADPLKSAADAMALAVQAAKDGAADAKTKVTEMMPAVDRFVSRLTYTTFYAISYGVVFPTLLLVRSVPKENAIVHGLIDGGAAARDAVDKMRSESSPAATETAPEHADSSFGQPESPPGNQPS